MISIHAYDCLAQVNYAIRINAYEDYQHDNHELVFAQAGTFPGCGETDPVEWLRDLLVAILEDL